MDAFSIFGLLGFIFGVAALAKVTKLEKQSKDPIGSGSGVI